MFPFTLLSQSTHPPVLNELKGNEEEEDPPPAKEEDPPENLDSQEDDPDAPDADTPAGKKFAQMRKDLKESKGREAVAEAARLKAEAKAEAIAEYKAAAGKEETVKPKEEEVDIHPDDLKTVQNALRKMGIDPNSLKDLQSLPKATQQMVAENQIDRASSILEKKYADSVPFDRSKAIKFAVENKLGLAMPNAPFEKILEIAHKEMNEDALADWRYDQRKKGKKDSPKISDNGTGKKEVREEKPNDTAGFRRLAKQIVGD